MAGLPPTAVVVAFDYMVGGPLGRGNDLEADTSLPLSLEGADQMVEEGFERFLVGPIRMNGSARYSLLMWIGAEALVEERETGNQIVASITPIQRP